MPTLRPLARLAWREGRRARRRLFLSMSSIALGVAALVSIDSYAANVTTSVRAQSRELMGGDVQLTSRYPFTPAIERLLDSLAHAGIPNTRITNFPSMVRIPRTQGVRLAQIRGVAASYPFYGTITTTPAGQFPRIQSSATVVVDPSLLLATHGRVGDTLVLGFSKFVVAGTLKDVPGNSDLATALGPRVFVAQSQLAATQLLAFGSTAEYVALLELPPSINPDQFARPLRERLDAQQISIRTVTQSEQRATNAIETLTQFIGVVGLIALLLGGVGVASGVRAFVARKIDTVAILRCLGATSGQVLTVYVAQAAIMGLLGAALGALLGIGVQYGLPYVIGQFLPVDVPIATSPIAVVMGIVVGGWVALVFALQPLLALRGISPLQTLRRDTDAAALGRQRRDIPALLVYTALVASVVLVAVLRASTVKQGLWIAGATGLVIALLVASATAVSWLARRVLRQGWPYVIRQGVANLYRPGNQTRAVMLSLGFGAFLLATLYFVQHSILATLSGDAMVSHANMIFFDVQREQVASLDSLIHARGFTIVQSDPAVSMRIAAINGVPTASLAPSSDSVPRRGGRWALKREYRSTFRDSLRGGETLVAGRWFRANPSPSDTTEVSLEAGIAKELHVSVGNVITWDIQGVQIPARVTSLRDVQWTRFEPNFFAVFPTAGLRDAPAQYILLANVPGDSNVAALQRDVAIRAPNISSLDLGIVTATLGRLVDKVDTAIRFMALFSLAMGIPVLFSAVAATRRDRMREGVLLKTLGASRAQVAAVLLTEYAVLGVLGSVTGVLLAAGAAWGLMHGIFSAAYVVAPWPAVGIAVAMTALTVAIGGLAGRDVFRETAMAALRD